MSSLHTYLGELLPAIANTKFFPASCLSRIALAKSLAIYSAPSSVVSNMSVCNFSSLVRSGEFDRILVRPQNEILQVLGSRFELTRAGRLLQAVVMFVYGILESEIAWDPLKILTVILRRGKPII